MKDGLSRRQSGKRFLNSLLPELGLDVIGATIAMKQRLADNISLVAQSPALDMSAVEIAITIPTFRRPDHVLKTIDSVAAQTTDRPFAIVLIENEAEDRAGAKAASPRFEDGTYRGLVIVAHDRGNCQAYNAGWFTAFTLFPNLRAICVLDDDEIADPDWIENLCATAERFDCGLVGGPQWPVFEGTVNAAWATHPVFTPHYRETGPVHQLYSSGNLLVRRDVLEAMPQPYLDPVFNFTGGGDSDFLMRARRAGFKTAWCTKARVHETIPASRVTRSWIRQRALRAGQLSARIEHRRRAGQPFGYIITVAHSLALLAASPFRSALSLVSGQSPLGALYPFHIALGRIGSEFGRSHEQYRNPVD